MMGYVLESLYSIVVIHCVFEQIQNLQNCFTTPNKTWEGRGPQTPAAKPLFWSIFKKSRHLGFGVFILYRYLVHATTTHYPSILWADAAGLTGCKFRYLIPQPSFYPCKMNLLSHPSSLPPRPLPPPPPNPCTYSSPLANF